MLLFFAYTYIYAIFKVNRKSYKKLKIMNWKKQNQKQKEKNLKKTLNVGGKMQVQRKIEKHIDENRRKHIQKQDEELIKLVSKFKLNKNR